MRPVNVPAGERKGERAPPVVYPSRAANLASCIHSLSIQVYSTISCAILLLLTDAHATTATKFVRMYILQYPASVNRMVL